MRASGIIVIILAVGLPLPWFWELWVQHNALAVLSQYLGSVALILMGISQLLATRWTGLETVFGGLDRMYVLHKWLGVSAMAAVLLHDTIDADLPGIGRETVLTDIAETLGEVSLYGLLILVVLSIATFVPYHLWKYTHKLMGAFFAAAAAHYAFILRPFELSDPVGLYVLSFCLLGIACYLYTLVPFGVLQGKQIYQVTDISETGGSTAVTMQAMGSGIRHAPGQFAFVSFSSDELSEPHPFTISSAPNKGRVRITVKKLGDYTTRLARELRVGETAKLSGGFGHFRRRKHGGTDIWIAGGIGITPFLALAGAQDEQANSVHLFHCVSEAAQAPHREDLIELEAAKANLTYHVIERAKRERLTAAEALETAGADAANIRVYFCGPEAMRHQMMEGFRRLGLRPAHFYFEEFEIRSGLGLRKRLGWLVPRLLPLLKSKT